MNHFKHLIRDISKIKPSWTHCCDIDAPIPLGIQVRPRTQPFHLYLIEYKEQGKELWESVNGDPNVPTI